MKIGLFYGSTTCYTEMAAEKIRALIGPELVDLHNIKDVPLTLMQEYDILILGISTWDFGELQEDWESRWEDIQDVELEGRIIALFGMGDQLVTANGIRMPSACCTISWSQGSQAGGLLAQ